MKPDPTRNARAALVELMAAHNLTRGDVARMDFGRAWERNHNAEDGDDVWVVGWCKA